MDAPETLLFTDRDVRSLLPMRECIEVVDEALRGLAAGTSTLPLRSVLRLPGTQNAFASMPALHGAGPEAVLGAKIITVFPGNAGTAFDAHIGVVLLFDGGSGALLAIADASTITSIRTAAVSGLATRLLAREDARELALLGAGTLALPHLEALRCVREIRRVRIWSRNAERARECAARAREQHDLEVLVAPSARAAVEGADIVCTLTGARTPLLEGAWLAPGAHVNAVGACFPDARELDSAAVAGARLFVDRLESALAEAGDILIPLSEGAISRSHVLGELGELAAGRLAGRTSATERTLFKSLGLAVEDVAALQHVRRRALERGGCRSIRLGGLRAAD